MLDKIDCSEISLERLGEHWRLRHSNSQFEIACILKAVSLPEFETQMRADGYRLGSNLAEEIYAQPMRNKDLLAQSQGPNKLKTWVGGMIEKSYAEKIPEIGSLALDLGLVRHCSIFESFLKALVVALSRAKPELIEKFRLKTGLKRGGLKKVVECFGKSHGISRKLTVVEEVMGIQLDCGFILQDAGIDLDDAGGRNYLEMIYTRRANFVHSMIPDVKSLSDLETVTHFFEHLTPGISRAAASAIGIVSR